MIKCDRMVTCIAIFLFVLGGLAILFFPMQWQGYGYGQGPIESLDECPNILVRQDGKIYLMNTSLDASNSIIMTFNNLDEYKVYTSNSDSCPILYLQEENNTQGQVVYRTYETPFDALPINPPSDTVSQPMMPPPFSLEAKSTMLSGFDSYGIDQGKYTSIDAIHDSTKTQGRESDNPMDDNWGGVSYTNSSIANGKYIGSELYKASYPMQLSGAVEPGPDAILS